MICYSFIWTPNISILMGHALCHSIIVPMLTVVHYILNKSENATPELFATYIQKLCKPRMQLKVYLNVQILGNA